MEINDPRLRSLLRQAERVAASGKRAAAESLYREIVEEAPKAEAAWLGLADVLTDNGERTAVYERVLQINPDNEVAQAALGQIQANPDAPLYTELCSIIQKTVGLVGPLTSALKPLSKHIELAFVFGSVAKKTDSASSDIDLMIVSDTLVYADVFPAIEEVSHELGREIQPTIYSTDELASRLKSDNSFIKRVMEQPKIWIIGNESDLKVK